MSAAEKPGAEDEVGRMSNTSFHHFHPSSLIPNPFLERLITIHPKHWLAAVRAA
jgi:hypothetical protein